MSERAAALADVVREIRERHGHLAVARGVPDELLTRCRRPADPLPPWWPGRLPVGHRIVELAGPPSCGKLSLALLWLAALRHGGLIAVIDAAGTFCPPAAAAAGLDLEHLVVVRPPGPRETLEAATLLAGAGGFDALLWPIDRRTRPNGIMSQKLAHAAARSSTRILALSERPHRADWWGLASSDVCLAVTRHEWRWVDGELAGVDLDVRAERVRGMTIPDWSFTLDWRNAGRIAASGVKESEGSRVQEDEVAAPAV